MFCPYCGKETMDGARFCAECGKALPTLQQAQQPAAAVEAPPVTLEQQSYASSTSTAAPEQSYAPPTSTAAPEPSAPPQTLYAEPVQVEIPPAPEQSYAPPPPPPAAPYAPPVSPEQQSYAPPSPAQPAAPYAQPTYTPPPVSPALAPASKNSSLRAVIVCAAIVVILGAGFATAWFTGALNGLFGLGGGGTGGGETVAVLGGGQVAESPSDLFSKLDIKRFTSQKKGPEAQVEESLVNLSNGLLGSARNISEQQQEAEKDTIFGSTFSIALNLDDAYIQKILEMTGQESQQQVVDIVRLIGKSELRLEYGIDMNMDSDVWSPKFGLDAGWLVGGESILTAVAHMADADVFFKFPELSPKVFHLEAPNFKDTFADLNAAALTPANLKKLGDYSEKAMPIVQEMILAAVGQFEFETDGTENIDLGSKSVTFETASLTITDKDALLAAKAALETFANNPESVELAVQIWNDVFAPASDAFSITKDELNEQLDQMFAELDEEIEYASDGT
ncbi:MAG: zinc ribbon domain-containing protein, partial [Clostridiales bacterium]|nr:zinc ribbon domain-containing protein [Clostridiales bacterium]